MSEDIAVFGLEVDSSGVIKATKALDKLEKQSGETEGATDRVEKAAGRSKVAMGAYALAAAAVTAALYKTVEVHKEFGMAISDLAAITGAAGADLEFYKDQALAIGESTTLSATQAATAFKLIASAKPDLLSSKEALAGVTFEAVKLAEAASIDMPAAADALGSALNQFGAGADQASRFINVLAAGAKFGASEISDTSVALREAGTVASGAGLSFEETNAALQSLSTVAIKGSKAGVALRNILVNLQTQSDSKINPAIVGLNTALANLSTKQLNTTEMSKLFGKEQLAAAQALINNASQVKKLTDNLTGTQTAYEQASIKVDNLAGDTKKMSSAWESAALSLGEIFNPAMRATTQFITDLAKPIKQLILEFGDLGDALGAYVAIAASALTLDFDGVTAIIDARKEERALIDEKIAKIWEEKAATDALNDSKNKGATSPNKITMPVTTIHGGQTATGQSDSAVALTNPDDLAAQEQDRIAAALDAHYQYEINKSIITEQQTQKRRALMAAEAGAAGNILTGLSSLMSREGKKQNATQKILARAGIIASTAQAVMNALAVPPYPLGVSLAVGAALQGAKQLKVVGGGGGGGVDTPPLQSPNGFKQDSLASNTRQRDSNFPSNVNINITGGAFDRDTAEKMAESLRELFADGGRQYQ